MQMNVDGQRVKTLRLRQSWSQELLAEKAGVSMRTIQRIEGGDVASLQSLRAVAAALGVPAASLAVLPADTDSSPPQADAAATVPFKDLLRTALPAVAVTLLLGVGLIAFHFAGDRDAAGQLGAGDVAESAPRVVTVGYGSIEHAVVASAKLEPSRTVRVEGVPGARVERMLVAIGDDVEEDQLLAYLDSKALRNRMESAEAGAAIQRSQMATRESALRLATTRFEEAQRRYAAEGGDERARDFEEARHGVVTAEAELFETRQRVLTNLLEVEAVRTELDRYVVKAPMAGTVVSISAAPGAVLDRDAPVLLELADYDLFNAVVAIAEVDLDALRDGGEAYVTTLYGGERRWQGTLRKILPVPSSQDAMVSYRGIVELDNTDRGLISAMTAQAFFPLESAENVLVVPVAALMATSDDGEERRATVRVVSPDGGTEIREIVVGAVDRVNAEVKSGLREGERVITDGQSS